VVVWSNLPAVDNLIRAGIHQTVSASFDMALGEQMLNTAGDYVQDLGALPIPPGGYVAGMGTGMYAAIKSLTATGSDTLGIDWLQIFPTGVGRYRVIKGIVNFGMSTNEEVIDDGPNNACYGLSGANTLPIFRPLHTPIYLWPGRAQRFRLLISGGSSIETGVAWGVKVEYRPRRLSF